MNTITPLPNPIIKRRKKSSNIIRMKTVAAGAGNYETISRSIDRKRERINKINYTCVRC